MPQIYTRHLHATQQEPLTPQQVKNSAGGYVYALDCWARLDRFLILGTDGGTYYASERDLTREQYGLLDQCLATDGVRAVQRIVEISTQGRAPKNTPAEFALMYCLKKGETATRQAAADALPTVARIGTHVFHCAEFVKHLGGWGRATRRAFAEWYQQKNAPALARQLIKYQQRNGWSHADVLRKCHPTSDGHHAALYHYATRRALPSEADGMDEALQIIAAYEEAKQCTRLTRLIELIHTYDLPHECIPNTMKDRIEIWDALVPTMGLTALLRNVARLTANGTLAHMRASNAMVMAKLTDPAALRAARVHPLQCLVALNTYVRGAGVRGSLTWSPLPQISDALNQSFYASLGTITPSGKRTLLALDVSGSMASGEIAGLPGMNPRVASAAMAMLTARSEPIYHLCGFTHGFVPLSISPTMRLDAICHAMNGLPFERTDCAVPMLWARSQKVPVDLFVIYTDNETWAGDIHPKTALDQYRHTMGINAKVAVVGMTATGFSIADPQDTGMLDMVGFDTAAPQALAAFATLGDQ